MKIRIVKAFQEPKGKVLGAGGVYEARRLASTPFQLGYQIIEGELSGVTVPLENAMLFDEAKSYSEKQFKEVENYYRAKLEKERELKNKAQDALIQMSKEVVKKNKEIEKLDFYVTVLSNVLFASSEAIQLLREKDKV